jgi:hypothetical protein
LTESAGLKNTLRFGSIDCELALAEVNDKVEFNDADDEFHCERLQRLA